MESATVTASRRYPLEREIRVGLCGCGVIGEGVVTTLLRHADIIGERVGAPVRLVAVADKDPARLDIVRAQDPNIALLDDAFEITKRDDVDIVVELIGGIEVADRLVRAALDAKKHVVTANKALLAERGAALFALAKANGCDLYFEAAVAGAIPVIRVIRESLAGDRIRSVRGIINGTSNYILSRMANEGAAFANALKAAQEAGFAEADPTLDVTGGDAGHKLALIAALAFGARVLPSEIPTEGIEEVDPRDIQYARKFGYAIRPLAVAEHLEDDVLDLRVHPALVPLTDSLAHVDGALNAVAIQGEMVGPSFLSGLGAGASPTATSVAGDIIDIARNSLAGGPVRTWHLPSERDQKIQPIADLSSRYYLRFSVRDQSGVLAALSGKLGDSGISIDQLVQDHEGGDAGTASIALLTHHAREGDVRDSLRAIESTHFTTAPTQLIRIVE
ncbi:MAG: homoserine dehydrogenase [Myxococcales bacterium]|nr:homoserine dehydrogenase [Myxococcales bacterium]MDH3842484.1 homoserine dehydrogenase [Myxococcales bacterium]